MWAHISQNDQVSIYHFIGTLRLTISFVHTREGMGFSINHYNKYNK